MTVHTLSCGDLAALGGPWDLLHQHDPDWLDAWHDTLCYCYTDGPPDYAVVCCREVRLEPVSEDYLIRLCCLCSPEYGDAVRRQGQAAGERRLFAWLRGQCREAIAYRDRRRLDSSPTIADMDVEAAAVWGVE